MPEPTKRFTRSRQMVDCLKEYLLYSDKRARDFLFDTIEGLIGHNRLVGTTMTVSRLIREAGERARSLASHSGFDFRSWPATARAVVNAMLAAGVLLEAGGSPIQPGVHAQAAEVHDMKPEFRDRTEAFLIEFLIRRLGDVGVRDHTALAHALFRQFDPSISLADLEDRVAQLLATLSDRLVLTAEGIYQDAGNSQ